MIHLVAIFQAQAATKRSDSEFASSIESEGEPILCGIVADLSERAVLCSEALTRIE